MSQVTVTVNLTRDANVRLAVSTDPGLSSPTYSSVVGTAAHRAKITMTGLAAGTQYYYGVEVNGRLNTTTTGSFRTPSMADTSLLVALSGDASTGSNHAVFDAIRTAGAHLFIHMGDIHYEDINTNQHYRHIGSIEHQFRQSAQHQLYRTIPTLYMWDDHDYGPNDSAGNAVSREAAVRSYRTIVPSPTLVESGATDAPYFSFERTLDGVGVVFIVTDQRSMSSTNATTDNSSKTILGTAQKTWFKNLISDSGNAEKLFVWVCTRVWGGVTDPGNDHWGSYTTERRELVDHIQTHAKERFVVLSADMHALAIDDGTNTNFATDGNCPLPTFQAAPLDRTGATTYGGATYSEGHFANNNQYGLMNIEKTGRKQLTVTWTGKRHNGTTLVTFPLEFNLGNIRLTTSTAGVLQKTGVTKTVSVTAVVGEPDASPWDEITRQETVSGGALTLSGLDLSEYIAVQFLLTGITTGTDDTVVKVRLHVGGTEQSGASDYAWGIWVGAAISGGFSAQLASTADDAITLTREGTATGNLGNDATEALSAVLTLFSPAGSMHKLVHGHCTYHQVASAAVVRTMVGGRLANTGAITGITVLGSSDLTGGRVIALGVK